MAERVPIGEIVFLGRGHTTWGAAWGSRIGRLSLLRRPGSAVG